MEKIKRVFTVVYNKWFSLSLCYISLYLATISYRQERLIFTAFTLGVVTIKVIGVILDHRHLRTIGIIGINVVWALTVLDFAQIGQSFYFSLFALLVGVGISVKGRFDE